MKKTRVSIKQRTHWIKSYLSIVLVISLVLLGYSAIIIRQIRTDTDKNNRRFAEYYNTMLEKNLKSLQDFSCTILYNKSAEKMHNYTKETVSSEEALKDAYNLVYDIRNFVLANGILDDIYIYYPEADQVVGRTGSFPSYTYFKTENVTMDPQMDEYSEWKNTLFSKRKNGFFMNTGDSGQGEIYYYRDINFGGNENESRVFVAKISQTLLNNFFYDLLSSANYQLAALTDAEGVVYAEAGNGTLFHGDNSRINLKSLNSTSNYVVYKAISDTWPLTFVGVQNYGSAYAIVRTVSIILIVGFIIALLIGILVSCYYAFKNRNAVEKIVNRFDRGEKPDNSSEFDFIGVEIDKLIQTNQQALDAADRQQKIIASFFLQELLNKESCTEKDVELISSMYDVNMENSMFSLVATWTENKSVRGMNRDKLLQFITEACDDAFVVYWTQIDNIEVFLCNYEGHTKSPQGPVLEFAKEMRNRQINECNIQISPVMYSSAEISSVWQQMYRQIVPQSSSKPKAAVNDDDILILREFNDALDNEDLTTAIRLVPELTRKFIENRNSNLALCRKYCLIAKLYECFDNDMMRRQIDNLMNGIYQKNWEQQLTVLLQSLDQDINQTIDMRHVAETAMDMILQEYNNPQLSLHMMAERIGISQSYLSRLFKQKYGMNVIQYLNYTRVEQAKKLMMEGNDNLKVIALNVGFLSDVNLIRVFKKYENTTPGDFRSRA